MLFVVCWFFQNQLFQKILSGIPSECQTDWIQIRPDNLSGLIWVQSVCKGYEQRTLVGNELKEWFYPYAINTKISGASPYIYRVTMFSKNLFFISKAHHIFSLNAFLSRFHQTGQRPTLIWDWSDLVYLCNRLSNFQRPVLQALNIPAIGALENTHHYFISYIQLKKMFGPAHEILVLNA